MRYVYRYKAATETGGIETLFGKSRRQPNMKNRVDEATEHVVLIHTLNYPAHKQIKVSDVPWISIKFLPIAWSPARLASGIWPGYWQTLGRCLRRSIISI